VSHLDLKLDIQIRVFVYHLLAYLNVKVGKQFKTTKLSTKNDIPLRVNDELQLSDTFYISVCVCV
jgi:uncharacterized phage protein (TIGR02220 family)